jgi:hypothetical protein
MPYNNNEKKRAWHKRYREQNKALLLEKQRVYYKLNKEAVLTQQSISNHRKNEANRIYLFDILGNKCIKCGITDTRVLQIDHISGGGRNEILVNKKLRGGQKKSGYYLKHPELISKIQLLCANCHVIKTFENREFIRKKVVLPCAPIISHYTLNLPKTWES